MKVSNSGTLRIRDEVHAKVRMFHGEFEAVISDL